MSSLDPSEPSRGAVSSPLARRRVLSADPLPPSSCVRVQNCAPAAESGLRAPRRRETKGLLSAYLHHPVEHRSSKQSRDILGMSWARYPVTDSLRDHCAFKHWMLSICTSLVNHSMTGLHYSDQDYPLRPFYWPTSPRLMALTKAYRGLTCMESASAAASSGSSSSIIIPYAFPAPPETQE